ncbi:MAG: hypothetical protein ABH860_00595, partial [bacterium]
YVWHSRNIAATFESNGHIYLRITEDGEGQYGSDKKYKTWHAESVYLYENDVIIPQNSVLEFKDKDGVTVGLLKVFFDAKEKIVKCKLLNEKKEFEFKEGLIDKNGLGTALMNYPYERKKDFVFPMLTDEPSFYNMTLVNKGIEVLTVNSRTIECYKIQMIPDLGFLGIFAPFVPKTYFWYKAASPHEFMRYEGLESGLNTPYIVMQVEE